MGCGRDKARFFLEVFKPSMVIKEALMSDSNVLWLAGFRKPKPTKNTVYFYVDKDAYQDTVTGDIWLKHTALVIARKRLTN